MYAYIPQSFFFLLSIPIENLCRLRAFCEWCAVLVCVIYGCALGLIARLDCSVQ